MGKTDALAAVLEKEKHDSVTRIALAAAGFAGSDALPLLAEFYAKDGDMRLRIVQTLRLVSGKAAKKKAQKLAAETVENIDDEKDGDAASMIRDAADDLSSED